MKIIQATINEIDTLAKLFDEYRVFYERDSDIDRARMFLSVRISNKESVIYLALDDNGNGMGFVQLYPSFTSVGMKRLWILNDLYVNENYRKTGVAENLINKCKELAKKHNAVGLILETRNENINAQNLYFKTDFIKDTEHTYFFWPNALVPGVSRETALSPAIRRMICTHSSLERGAWRANCNEWQLSHWISKCF